MKKTFSKLWILFIKMLTFLLEEKSCYFLETVHSFTSNFELFCSFSRNSQLIVSNDKIKLVFFSNGKRILLWLAAKWKRRSLPLFRKGSKQRRASFRFWIAMDRLQCRYYYYTDRPRCHIMIQFVWNKTLQDIVMKPNLQPISRESKNE